MQNPSIVLYGAKNAKLEDKGLPELVDPHDVLVRIAYIGVCGSDVSIIPPSFSLYTLSSNLLMNINRCTFGTMAVLEKWSIPPQVS
jgi:hypothetical protein